jgi:hypothetical protein
VQDRDLIRGPAAGHAFRSHLAHSSPSVGYLAPGRLGPSRYGPGAREANIGAVPWPRGHPGWPVPGPGAPRIDANELAAHLGS